MKQRYGMGDPIVEAVTSSHEKPLRTKTLS